jgi:hypothetical protein
MEKGGGVSRFSYLLAPQSLCGLSASIQISVARKESTEYNNSVGMSRCEIDGN